MSTTVPTTTTWSDIVQMIQAQGEQSGLSQDQINAAITIAKAEGGWSGNIGDNGTSYGVFQFHVGGMLDSFANWLGSPNLTSAGWVAVQQPGLAIQYALQPGGYLYNAVRNGSARGLSGLNLALYVEQFGQRAAQTAEGLVPAIVANVTAAWTGLFGSGKGNPTTTGDPDGTTTGITDGTATTSPKTSPLNLPNVTDIPSGLNAVAQAIANIGDAVSQSPANAVKAALAPLTSIVQVGEQLLWVLVGIVLIIVGLWLLVTDERLEMMENIATEAV